MTQIRYLLALLLPLSLTGCLQAANSDRSDYYTCTDNTQCKSGFTCANNRCVANSARDGSSPQDAGSDGTTSVDSSADLSKPDGGAETTSVADATANDVTTIADGDETSAPDLAAPTDAAADLVTGVDTAPDTAIEQCDPPIEQVDTGYSAHSTCTGVVVDVAQMTAETDLCSFVISNALGTGVFIAGGLGDCGECNVQLVSQSHITVARGELSITTPSSCLSNTATITLKKTGATVRVLDEQQSEIFNALLPEGTHTLGPFCKHIDQVLISTCADASELTKISFEAP